MIPPLNCWKGKLVTNLATGKPLSKLDWALERELRNRGSSEQKLYNSSLGDIALISYI